MSYLRIATHPAIFNQPLAYEEAARNVEALLAVPHCRVISEEEAFWDHYRELTHDLPGAREFGPRCPLGRFAQAAWCRDAVHPRSGLQAIRLS